MGKNEWYWLDDMFPRTFAAQHNAPEAKIVRACRMIGPDAKELMKPRVGPHRSESERRRVVALIRRMARRTEKYLEEEA